MEWVLAIIGLGSVTLIILSLWIDRLRSEIYHAKRVLHDALQATVPPALAAEAPSSMASLEAMVDRAAARLVVQKQRQDELQHQLDTFRDILGDQNGAQMYTAHKGNLPEDPPKGPSVRMVKESG